MALPVPPLLLITDRTQARRPLADIVSAALDAGCRWVSVREKDLGEAEQIALVEALRPLSRRYGARLTLHGTAALALRAATDGVHLPSGADVAAARRLLGPEALIGLSVHRSDELAGLAATPDYIMAGPAYETASKPGYGPALGPDGIAGLASASRNIFVKEARFGRTNSSPGPAAEQARPVPDGRPLPVVAIGGITPATVASLTTAGAAGIAVMGGVMRAEDPGAEVRALLAAMAG